MSMSLIPSSTRVARLLAEANRLDLYIQETHPGSQWVIMQQSPASASPALLVMMAARNRAIVHQMSGNGFWRGISQREAFVLMEIWSALAVPRS